MTFTPEEIQRLRALCDAATDGPWDASDPAMGYVQIMGGFDGDADDNGACVFISTHVADIIDNRDEIANMDFIVAARTVLPAALDEIDRLSASLSKVTAERDAGIEANHALVAANTDLAKKLAEALHDAETSKEAGA